MPTLFISYKRGTTAIAPLMERLKAAGYRLWFDRNEIHLGDKGKASHQIGNEVIDFILGEYLAIRLRHQVVREIGYQKCAGVKNGCTNILDRINGSIVSPSWVASVSIVL